MRLHARRQREIQPLEAIFEPIREAERTPRRSSGGASSGLDLVADYRRLRVVLVRQRNLKPRLQPVEVAAGALVIDVVSAD